MDSSEDGGFRKNDVVAVKTPEQASEFYIVPTYDSKHPHEFAIAYYSQQTYVDVNTVPRYLNAPTDIHGRNDGPLRMEFGITEHNCRLTLDNRLPTDYEQGDITPWIMGQDAFYLKCARRVFRRNGYMCVKRLKTKKEHTTACVKTNKEHDEGSGTYMVFRLIRPKQLKGGKVKDSDGRKVGPIEPGPPHKLTVTAEIEDTTSQ